VDRVQRSKAIEEKKETSQRLRAKELNLFNKNANEGRGFTTIILIIITQDDKMIASMTARCLDNRRRETITLQ